MKKTVIIVAALVAWTCFQAGNLMAESFEIRWWPDICTRSECSCSEISASIKDRPDTKDARSLSCGGWINMYITKPADMISCTFINLKARCTCSGTTYEKSMDVSCHRGKAYLNYIYQTGLSLSFHEF